MIARHILPDLLASLQTEKIVLLTGARQVGKTTLMKECIKMREKEGKPSLFITLEKPSFKDMFNADPESLLPLLPTTTEKVLVCVDEIQYLDNPTSFMKFLYDMYRDRIKLFVTGSSSFYIDHIFKDSLAGRNKIFELGTLSFREFLAFKNQSHLVYNALYKGQILAYFDEYLRYGGYPELVCMDNEADKEAYLQSLVSTYIQKDITDAGIRYVDKYLHLLQLLADQTGKLVNMSELGNILGLSTPTISDYLYTMQKSFHIGLLRPFAKNIRKEITRMPKVYFHDAGLRNYCLNNYRTLSERQDKGECLEQYVWRKLQAQYNAFNLHYRRSKNNDEVDFVMQGYQGSEAREIKRNKKSFHNNHYAQFQKDYPTIPLVCKDLEDIIRESM